MRRALSNLWVKIGLLLLGLPPSMAQGTTQSESDAIGAAVLTQSLEDSPTNETAAEQAITGILSPSGW